MLIYRLTSKKYESDLSGIGANLYGGRWNNKGSAALYTGESQEIALLETVVHTPPMLTPSLVMVTLEIPDDSIEEIKLNQLPSNWKRYPAPTILAEIGNRWIRSNSSIALKVPSCIIESAHIFVLNAQHPDYLKSVKIVHKEDFHFDSRLKS